MTREEPERLSGGFACSETSRAILVRSRTAEQRTHERARARQERLEPSRCLERTRPSRVALGWT